MNECIFCAIANSNDMSKLVWQNDVAAAFKSISPMAPVHLLVVPKSHLENLDDLHDEVLAGKLLVATREVAQQAGLTGAWKMRANNGIKAGQTVPHLHFHILGGKEMSE
jgi:histidine triad (HIT) family protein